MEEAALALFREQGYAGTTIEDIADRAGVSPRTFARYFGSKEEVAVGHPEELLAQFRREVRQAPAELSEVEVAVHALYALARRLEHHRDLVLTRVAVVNEEPALRCRLLEWKAMWEEALAAELASRSGAAVPALAHNALAALAVACVGVAFTVWLTDGGSRHLEDLVREVFDEVVGVSRSVSTLFSG